MNRLLILILSHPPLLIPSIAAYPSSSPAPSACPSHQRSQSSLAHTLARYSLNVNHISVSFIRLCAILMFTEQFPHHQAPLFIHDDSKVARDVALFSTSPNIHAAAGRRRLTSCMPASFMIYKCGCVMKAGAGGGTSGHLNIRTTFRSPDGAAGPRHSLQTTP